jgi:hypothetical protein
MLLRLHKGNSKLMEYEHGASQGDSDREKPKLTTPNQQKAQNYSLDVYNITLNIYTRFDPHGTTRREANQGSKGGKKNQPIL